MTFLAPRTEQQKRGTMTYTDVFNSVEMQILEAAREDRPVWIDGVKYRIGVGLTAGHDFTVFVTRTDASRREVMLPLAKWKSIDFREPHAWGIEGPEKATELMRNRAEIYYRIPGDDGDVRYGRGTIHGVHRTCVSIGKDSPPYADCTSVHPPGFATTQPGSTGAARNSVTLVTDTVQAHYTVSI